MELADELGLEVPIASEVYAVLNKGRSAVDAYRGLNRHSPGTEYDKG
jgi:glycerol-3-phosphate dehydrogenase (NAD(P)+)